MREVCIVILSLPKQERNMNTKFAHDRELSAGELNAVSGGRGHFKSLESQDKLGNFEIQTLMSSFNQASGLASSVQKKADEAASSVIGKI